MKIIFSILAIATLTACSSKPSDTDVKNSLESELKQSCEFASVTSAKVLNTAAPDSKNENYLRVKYSATVKVVVSGPLKQRADDFPKAKAAYDEFLSQSLKLSSEYSPRIKALKDEESELRNDFRISTTLAMRQATQEELNYFKEKTDEIYKKIEAVGLEQEAKVKEIRQENEKKYGSIIGYKLARQPEMPVMNYDCTHMGNPNRPLGIIYKQVREATDSDMQYFTKEGASAEIESERVMTKTDNGWVFAGQL